MQESNDLLRHSSQATKPVQYRQGASADTQRATHQAIVHSSDDEHMTHSSESKNPFHIVMKYFFDIVVQTIILLKKNVILYVRKWPSTAVQILSPIVIIALLWLIVLIVEKVRGGDEYVTAYPGKIEQPADLPRCKPYSTASCYTLVYATNNNAFADQVITQFKTDTGLVDSDLKKFTYQYEMDDWILANPNVTQSAVSFSNTTRKQIAPSVNINMASYILYYNSTKEPSVGARSRPVQLALDLAIMQLKTGQRPSITATWRGYPNPAKPTNGQLQVFGFTGPNFFTMSALIILIIATHAIVTEKELHLRFGMTVMGLRGIAYWISWAITFFIISLLNTLITIGMGAVTGVYIFTNSNFLTLFLMFFLFTLSLVCLAFFLSAFINTGRAALIVGFIVLGASFILNLFLASPLLVNLLFSTRAPRALPFIFYLYPPFNFGKIFSDINRVTQPTFDGMTRTFKAGGFYNVTAMGDWNIQGTGDEEVRIPPTYFSLVIMVIDSIIFLVLGWYAQHVLPQDGVQHPPWFFLMPSYYGIHLNRDSNVRPDMYSKSKKDLNQLDEDIRKEYHVARDPSRKDLALRIVGLKKTYRRGFKTVRAVRGLDLVVPKGSCLALLGHNGAGKSTTFSILTGLIKASTGDCFVNGKSIRYDLASIRKKIGYCPQHDILLPELTAWQHMELFAVLKSVPLGKIRKEIQERLRSVNLWGVRNKMVKTYSGGMKRRLSVAIACIGDPELLLLDEMTTGMDPYSVRQVWQLIQSMKGGRVIVLTTHAMDEADALADRIAIMAGGLLRCVGDSLELKKKYGAGHNLNLVSHDGQTDRMIHLVKEHMGNQAVLETCDAGNCIFTVLPRYSAQLVKFLRFLEDDDSHKDIVKGWSISHTTLEEVYLNITTKAGFSLGGDDHPAEEKETENGVEQTRVETINEQVLEKELAHHHHVVPAPVVPVEDEDKRRPYSSVSPGQIDHPGLELMSAGDEEPADVNE